jgi:hypothetical protein
MRPIAVVAYDSVDEVLDTAPKALEEHVIAPRAPAVHADRNPVLEQDVLDCILIFEVGNCLLGT